jgi:hypothetical protein
MLCWCRSAQIRITIGGAEGKQISFTVTLRKRCSDAQQEVLKRVNRYVRGGVNYFHLHNSTRVFVRQRQNVEEITSSHE